jgi:hypothetical protein
MSKDITNYAITLSPCNEWVEYRKQYSSDQEAWENCPRGDWMLWIAFNLQVNIHTLTLTKGYCAKTVIHLTKDQRSKDAIKAAIQFGHYKISKESLTKAAGAARAAAEATWVAGAAAGAARAAAEAAGAGAAAGAARAAAEAAEAARAAAGAARAARAAWAARKQNQLQTANICRKYLSKAVAAKYKQLSK